MTTSTVPRRHRSAPLPAAVLLATVLTVCAGWAFKAHCVLDGGWTDGEQYTTGCYTDVVPFWTERGVAAGALPYLDTPLEYPVLTGAQISGEGAVSRLVVGPEGTALAFLTVVSIVNGALTVGILLLLHRLGVPSSRLWWWALAPAVVLYVGHNWDLLAMFLAVAAIAAQQRDRPGLAGVAVGLGVAAKLYPGLLLPLLALTPLRRRDWRSLAAVLGGAAGAWLVVNLPVALAAPARWAEFYTFSQERLGTFAASWTVLGEAGVLSTSVSQRNLWASLLFVAGAAAIVAAGWRRHAGHEWVLLTPLLAWFLLTTKVYSPQFDLWLVPLLVLTMRRTWPIGAFVAADIAVYWTEFWYLGWRSGLSPAAPYPALGTAAVVRAAILLCIIVLAVRDHAPRWIAGSAAPPAVPDEATPVGADSR